MPRFALLPLLALVAGCTINALAPTPTPNVIAKHEPGTATLVALHVPDSVCSKHSGLKDFCIAHLATSMRAGLTTVLAAYFASPGAGSGPAYQAEFNMLELNHSPTSAGGDHGGVVTVQLSMRWQFVLRDEAGHTALELAETTVGPEQLVNVDAGSQIVGALLNAVLERIAKGLDGMATAPAPSAASAGRCFPGVTQACLGPGACKGAQFCLKDASGFSACDCGATPTPAQ